MENSGARSSSRLQEDDVNPAVAMQLADIGQVVSFPAHPIGDLTIPRANLALRAPELGEPRSPDPALVAAASELDEPTAEQERSSPAAALKRSEEIKQRDERHLVVLVWIAGTSSG